MPTFSQRFLRKKDSYKVWWKVIEVEISDFDVNFTIPTEGKVMHYLKNFRRSINGKNIYQICDVRFFCLSCISETEKKISDTLKIHKLFLWFQWTTICSTICRWPNFDFVKDFSRSFTHLSLIRFWLTKNERRHTPRIFWILTKVRSYTRRCVCEYCKLILVKTAKRLSVKYFIIYLLFLDQIKSKFAKNLLKIPPCCNWFNTEQYSHAIWSHTFLSLDFLCTFLGISVTLSSDNWTMTDTAHDV